MIASRDQTRHPASRFRSHNRCDWAFFPELRSKFARVPNLFRVLANAPVALEGLSRLSGAHAGRAIAKKTREQRALAIAESNLCTYCLSAHTAVTVKIGLNKTEIDQAIRPSATAVRTDAILELARYRRSARRTHRCGPRLCSCRRPRVMAKLSRQSADVALNIFEKYMSHLGRVSTDFPQAESRETAD
jgi:AhpD family alkylhydroperoxidase